MSYEKLPLSVFNEAIGIGTARYDLKDVGLPGNPYYWMVIVDRKDLKVVANVASDSVNTVPSAVKKYDGNQDYILIATSHNFTCRHCPTGELDAFLKNNGAGTEYDNLQQIAGLVESIREIHYEYLLVSVMGNKEEASERMSIGSTLIFLPMALININGQYTPVILG